MLQVTWIGLLPFWDKELLSRPSVDVLLIMAAKSTDLVRTITGNTLYSGNERQEKLQPSRSFYGLLFTVPVHVIILCLDQHISQ